MRRNKSIKSFIIIFALMLLVTVSIVIILHSKNKDREDNYDPSIIANFPGKTFAHIKIIEEDERELFYYYTKYNISIEDAEVFPMKLFTFEIKELFIHDSFQTYTNSPVYKAGDKIQIAFALSLYDILSDYDEFIIEPIFLIEDLYTENRDDILRYVYLVLPIQNQKEKVTIDGLMLPVKDDKLQIQDFIDQDLLDYHVLLRGNELVKDSNYHVKDGLTIEDLRQYFEIVVNRVNEFKD